VIIHSRVHHSTKVLTGGCFVFSGLALMHDGPQGDWLFD
jgi:hypothetical protein